jgi:hypothetical protein
MVFIGDGETDIPCMRLVKDQGGHAIAVYAPRKQGAKEKATKLVEDGRGTLAATADYREGSTVDVAVKAMIDKIAAQSIIDSARSN